MKLLTKEITLKLVNNYTKNQAAMFDDTVELNDHKPVVKLFTPDAGCTWLLTELNPEDNVAFGLADLGLGQPELGYVSMDEIATVRGKLGLPVERDRHWQANRTLSEYASLAYEKKTIVDHY